MCLIDTWSFRAERFISFYNGKSVIFVTAPEGLQSPLLQGPNMQGKGASSPSSSSSGKGGKGKVRAPRGRACNKVEQTLLHGTDGGV